jgi:hypothetical protein
VRLSGGTGASAQVLFWSLERGRREKMSITKLAAVAAALVFTAGTASAQSAKASHPTRAQLVAWCKSHPTATQDCKEVRADTREVRSDRKELRSDRRAIRADVRQGNKAEVKADKRELKSDGRELRQDRKDRRQDARDTRKDARK